MKARLEQLLERYGTIAVVIYVVLFAVTLAAFAVALGLGLHVSGAAGTAGTLGGAWVATKLTQPLRIGATLVLTPVVDRLRPRRRAVEPGAEAPPE